MTRSSGPGCARFADTRTGRDVARTGSTTRRRIARRSVPGGVPETISTPVPSRSRGPSRREAATKIGRGCAGFRAADHDASGTRGAWSIHRLSWQERCGAPSHWCSRLPRGDRGGRQAGRADQHGSHWIFKGSCGCRALCSAAVRCFLDETGCGGYKRPPPQRVAVGSHSGPNDWCGSSLSPRHLSDRATGAKRVGRWRPRSVDRRPRGLVRAAYGPEDVRFGGAPGAFLALQRLDRLGLSFLGRFFLGGLFF
jgi:hypothetical protein